MSIQRTIAAVLTILFLGVMFGGLFHMGTGMDMTGTQTGCPFMIEQETICSMSVLEHLSAWQANFLAIGTSAATLLIGLLALALFGGGSPFPSHVRNLAHLSPMVILQNVETKLLTFCQRALQELFARGVLHPKLFS